MNTKINDAPGNTRLTDDERAQLIPSLATKHELNEFERQNILEAFEWAMSPRVRIDLLTEPFVRTLHKRMFNATWKWAGRYRTTEKNIGVPFYQIPDSVGQLLGNARYWMEQHTFDLDEIAVRLHHRMVLIHPFPNGNGRHARLLADALVTRHGGKRFTWGGNELVEAEAIRAEYIALLKAADRNHDDIRPLVDFARR